VERLDSAHSACCPWRGNPCSPWLMQFPTMSQDTLIEQYERRLKELSKIDKLPAISSGTTDAMVGLREAAVRHLFGGAAEAQRSRAQQLIAVCGWDVHPCGFSVGRGGGGSPAGGLSVTPRRGAGGGELLDSGCVMLHCSMCDAKVGLWNYSADGANGSAPLWQSNFLPRRDPRPPEAGGSPRTPSGALAGRQSGVPDVRSSLSRCIGGGELDSLAFARSPAPGAGGTPWSKGTAAARAVRLASASPAVPVFGSARKPPVFGSAGKAGTAPAAPESPAFPSPPTSAAEDGAGAARAEDPEGSEVRGSGGSRRGEGRGEPEARAPQGALDPVGLHRPFCPWVSTRSGDARNLKCGWMHVVDALFLATGGAADSVDACDRLGPEAQGVNSFRQRFVSALGE